MNEQKNIIPNSVFWGKKEEKDGNLYWLPLLQHLEDTKGVMGLLWEHWLGKNQKDLIMEELNLKNQPDKTKQFLMFLAAVHDIGKATPAFQISKLSPYYYEAKNALNDELREKIIRAGFFSSADNSPNNPEKSHHTITGQVLLEEFGIRRDIASIIGAHHGKPISDEEVIETQIKAYPSNYYLNEDSKDETHIKWAIAQKTFFDWALKNSSFTIETFPRVPRHMQVLLSGIVIVADWISSNTDFFPLFNVFNCDEKPKLNRLENGYKKWQLTNCWIPEQIKNVENYYINTWGFVPNELQSKIFKIIKDIENPGIMILEAPMGIGKTEVALASSLQLANKLGYSGLFFGLPTQATSNSMFNRVSEWLSKTEVRTKKGIRLSHGKAHLYEEFNKHTTNNKLKEWNANTNIDGTKEENLIVNDWFSGRKKTILDDFVVGTVDQLLMMGLKQKHFALRHLGFSKKIVIIDEVHAYDAYMSQYLLKSIKWLAAYNIPVILLSATLPNRKRNEIINAYIENRFPLNEFSEINELEDKSYPVFTYSDGLEIKQITNFKNTVNNLKEVTIKNIETNKLNSLLDSFKNKEGIIGIVVNTIRKAQEITDICIDKFGSDKVILIHSSFISLERLRIEKEIDYKIGKNGKRPKKLIVIGTQVLEQSLDIDFDLLITEIAPMDLVIQRIGRLHRHNIKRPKNFDKPCVYILNNSFDLNDKDVFDEGTNYVYGEYLLIKTLVELLKTPILKIPKDIPQLVNKVYESSDNTLEILQKTKPSYIKHQEHQKQKAQTFEIVDPYKMNRVTNEGRYIIGMLEGCTNFEEEAYAQVRDSNESIEVIALREINGGYGLFGEDKDLSDKIDDPRVGMKIASSTIRLPGIFSSSSYNYNNTFNTIEELEKFNLLPKNKLYDWQKTKWLKGSLGIIFDKNNSFELNGYTLSYDEKFGLAFKKNK